MPYGLKKSGSKWCVFKQAKPGDKSGPNVPGGCHAKRDDAVKHLRALYSNVADAKKGDHSMKSIETMTFELSALSKEVNDSLELQAMDVQLEELRAEAAKAAIPSFHQFEVSATQAIPNGVTIHAQNVHFGSPSTSVPTSTENDKFSPIRLYFREGEKTPDGRVIDPNAVNFDRQPPYSIRLQTTQPESGGHAGAVVCGVITKIARDGTTIVADGFLDLTQPAGQQAFDLITNRTMQTWSPDLGDAVIDIERNTTDEDPNEATHLAELAHVVSATFLGATMVSMPALASAVVELLDHSGNITVPAPDRATLITDPVGVSTDPEESKQVIDRQDTSRFAETAEETFALHRHKNKPSDVKNHLKMMHGMFIPSDLEPDSKDPNEKNEPSEDAMHEDHAALHDGDIGNMPLQAYAAEDGYALDLTIEEMKTRTFPTDVRKKAAKSGTALPDGSFPIPDVDALKRAIRAIGRAKDPAAAKAHIKKRAKTLNQSKLIPSDWSLDLEVISACAASEAPPAEFFTDPRLTELQRWVTVTPEGRVFGHSAGKDECHIGYFDRCVTIDMIEDYNGTGNFEYAMPGYVITAEGTKVATGPIAVKGGHAAKGLRWQEALSHYDDPSSAVADVVYGRDEFGIWFSGAIRPHATTEQVHMLRASGVSLDAREINGQLRYLATCSVNTPGFPKATARIIASGDSEEPRVLALVGGSPSPSYEDEDCGCEDQSS